MSFGALRLKVSGSVMPAAASSPVLVQQAATGQSAAGTSRTVTLPSVPTIGNTLLLVARENSSGDAVTPPGWTKLGEQLPTGSTRPAVWFTKTSDGTEQTITVNFGASVGHGVAVQEWEGAVTFGTTSGVYIPSISNPQTCGPTDAPPSATAVPSMFLFWDDIGTNKVTWPVEWTGTSADGLNFAHNVCEVGTLSTPPNAAVSASLSFTSTPSSFMYWWNIWVIK